MNPSLPSPFAWTAETFGPALRSLQLEPFARHFFTTRTLTLRGKAHEDEWSALAAAVGVAPDRLFRLKQVHRTDVLVVRRDAASPSSRGGGADRATSMADADEAALPCADIVMTNDPQTAVVVQVADCVPVLLADSRSGAVAGVHAGWRGTAASAVHRAIEAMATEFNTRPADLVAAIGPSIGACCYQVGPDVLAAFEGNGFDRQSISRWFRPQAGSDRLRLDVAAANRDQLIEAGVDPASIAACGLCTSCNPSLFYSYRRDGAGTGRLAAVIRPLLQK